MGGVYLQISHKGHIISDSRYLKVPAKHHYGTISSFPPRRKKKKEANRPKTKGPGLGETDAGVLDRGGEPEESTTSEIGEPQSEEVQSEELQSEEVQSEAQSGAQSGANNDDKIVAVGNHHSTGLSVQAECNDSGSDVLEAPSQKADHEAPAIMPLISVIMTTYNCATYVSHAISSIQRQTLKNWELIIIDDCSTDASDDILRQFAHADDRIIYFRNHVNVGCYVSKNIGLLHARGTWVTFQDADDYSLASRLEVQLASCHANLGDCCYVRFLSRATTTWAWAPITLFIRKSTLAASVGFFDCVRFGADSELHSRILALGMRIHVTPTYLYACTDKWAEMEHSPGNGKVLKQHRGLSLTGNSHNDQMRQLYKDVYTHRHRCASGNPALLQYTFPPENDFHPCQAVLSEGVVANFLPNYSEMLSLYESHNYAIFCGTSSTELSIIAPAPSSQYK